MDKYKDLTSEALAALGAEKRTALAALFAIETPTVEQVAEAKAALAEVKDIEAEIEARTTAAAELADEFAALKTAFAEEPAEEEADEPAEEEADEEVEPEPEPVEEEPVAEAPKAARAKTVAAVARKATRPALPKPEKSLITITAAADSGYAAGSEIDFADVGQAAVTRLRGMPEPTGNGDGEELRMYPVAKVALDFPENLVISRTSEPDQVLNYASKEARLDGGSLVASAGWCAPSETLYDLCGGEVVDGMVSLPEVQVTRGGFKHTSGTDFSTVYSGVGFLQTEAQAIAGTTKTCYEVPCPTFTDERLKAIGLCIKVPILLQSAYPEQVTDIMNKSMIAHQYKVNVEVITRMLAIAGAARNFTTDLGSTVVDTLSGVDLVGEQLRQKYRLGQNATLELVFPVWARSVFRNDLGARNGRDASAVTDAEIAAHFAARHFSVQYVYSWQELTTTDLVWPSTVNFMAYPAGTFVKGVSDVINLSAVYDAASLAVNIYTGLFMEQGLLVAQMCHEAVQGTIPVCNAGRTGAANLTCA